MAAESPSASDATLDWVQTSFVADGKAHWTDLELQLPLHHDQDHDQWQGAVGGCYRAALRISGRATLFALKVPN